ncbi:MAG: NYN domain-containing protein [Pseudomonadota bacterium]
MSHFLGMRANEKTAVFIDGANLYKAARSLGFDMDYKNLLNKARANSQLLRAYYYTAMQEDRDQDYSPLRPLVDWLDYNGYSMVTKIAREYTDAQGRKRYRGSIDIELVTDLLLLSPKLDHIILFSGNGDFRRAVEAAQGHGARVTVISTVKSQPPMAADELRRQADDFFDLADLQKEIGRTGGQAGGGQAGGGQAGGGKPRARQETDDEDGGEFEDEYEFEDEDY